LSQSKLYQVTTNLGQVVLNVVHFNCSRAVTWLLFDC